MSSDDDERNMMIITLFNKGLKQKEISCALNSYGHKISERHLRRVLKLLGLKRRCPQRPFTEIHKAVESEMKQWSPEQGIRAMVKRVRDVRGVRPCYRDDVANIMRYMDASGLQRRSPGKKKIPRRNYISRGPNDTWHIDGNDKLKFFGMWIHLGIDGEFFKMRRTAINKTDWVDIKLKGGVFKHPEQKDTNSCDVIVILMAKAFMESFPQIPEMTFETTIKAMVQQREATALHILGASVFEAENNCAMCSTPKPPFPGPSITKWIQCDSCSRWFHTQRLQMNTELFQTAEAAEWECALCEKEILVFIL
ncbi:uncharacterized protein LOC120729347 [Simochromis diagramma]|uniref:uncharacterized protein LOC120729347 n=1 Tax=Simochromis diagramma TaxID=43689 RepID=UPI001A7E5B3F|nr:uncharacterized protein LOC120729347 [Simochromis diagramma]